MAGSRRLVLSILAVPALAWGACDCTVGEERPGGTTAGSEQPQATERPEPLAAPEEGCAAGTPAILESSGDRTPIVAVAISGERALVVHPTGEGSLKVWPTDPSGAPLGGPSTLPLPHADHLLAFEAVGPRFVALSGGECPDGIEGRRCFFARAMTADGAALGNAVPIGRGVLRSIRVRASDGSLYVAHSAEDGSVALDVLRPTVRGMEHERIELGKGRQLEGVHVEVLGLAVDGERWAVVWRAGATEDAASEVLVTTPEGEREAEPLHHALVIEQLRVSDDGLAAIAAFEFSRPKLVRLAPDGEVLADDEIAADARVPSPFAEALRAGVRFADGTLALVLRNGAGDRLETVELLDSSDPSVPHVGDVTRSGNGFLVAFTGPEANGHAVGTTRVQCAPGGP